MPVEWREQTPGEKYLDFDWIDEQIPKTHFGDMSRGWCLRHPNTTFKYNPTVPAKVAMTALSGLMNNLQNRWDFRVYKVDEYIEISPSHPMFQSIVRQKQDIIRQVKEGLAQVDRAVSDVELLTHDRRRYKEILYFFEKKDEHSLKAMFIDQVDVNLPEGVSLRSIAPRWPTIIADFMELNPDEDKTDVIMKKLGTSKAEAVILATKMRLYNRWKDFFINQVKDRYRAILERLYARKASIEEYRNWIRPLIRRILQIREVDDKFLAMNKNLPVGAGMPVALQYIEYWAWTTGEGLEPEEHHKVARERYETKGTGMSKGLSEYKVREGAVPRFRIEPYDDVVKKLIPEVEKRHGVKITKEDVLEARKRLYLEGNPTYEWYVLVHFPVSILQYKLPSGLDVEDVDFNKLSVVFLTQNMILLKILEMIAEEKKLDVYIDELLGKKVMVDGYIKEIDDLLHEDFPDIYKKEKIEEPKKTFLYEFNESLKKSLTKLQTTLNGLFGLKTLFVKGPYDPFFADRMTYVFGRPFVSMIFEPLIWSYMLKNFGGV
jgi:hypothetical protein